MKNLNLDIRSLTHTRQNLTCIKCGDPRADNSQAYCRKCFFGTRIGKTPKLKYEEETCGDSTPWFLDIFGNKTRYYGDITSCKS